MHRCIIHVKTAFFTQKAKLQLTCSYVLILIVICAIIYWQNKFFDSGDYNMAKSTKPGIPAKQPLPPAEKLLLPTPDTVPQRKSSIISGTKLYPNAP